MENAGDIKTLKKRLARLMLFLLSWGLLAPGGVFLFFPALPVHADSVILNPLTDAFIDAELRNGNFNTATLDVRRRGSNFSRRSLLRFDVAGAIPSGSTITSAVLKLVIAQNSLHSKTVNLHLVQQSPARDWTETEATWLSYKTGFRWSRAGADFKSLKSASVSIGAKALPGRVFSFSGKNLTADIQNFMKNPQLNFGWVLRDASDSSGTGQFVQFGSREAAVSLRPVLEITYTPPTGALSVDLVDGSGNPIPSPSLAFGPLSFSFGTQESTAFLGTPSQRIRITNTTSVPEWTLSFAPVDGKTTLWKSGGSVFYDFNDSRTDGTDDGDLDMVGGRLTIDPRSGIILPVAPCGSVTGINRGSPGAFQELPPSVFSVTLLSAGPSAPTNCRWDFRGVSLQQFLPPGQLPGDYTLSFMLTLL